MLIFIHLFQRLQAWGWTSRRIRLLLCRLPLQPGLPDWCVCRRWSCDPSAGHWAGFTIGRFASFLFETSAWLSIPYCCLHTWLEGPGSKWILDNSVTVGNWSPLEIFTIKHSATAIFCCDVGRKIIKGSNFFVFYLSQGIKFLVMPMQGIKRGGYPRKNCVSRLINEWWILNTQGPRRTSSVTLRSVVPADGSWRVSVDIAATRSKQRSETGFSFVVVNLFVLATMSKHPDFLIRFWFDQVFSIVVGFSYNSGMQHTSLSVKPIQQVCIIILYNTF